jgi:arylsulfatase A-like enzyme
MPGVVSRAIRTRRTASVVDIAPTILALTGVPIPAGYDGASLLHGNERLAFFFTDYSLAWAGLRDGCWKYLLEIEARRSRLFDVCMDPGEAQDVAASHAERAAVYRQRTLDWISSRRRKFVTAP